MEETLDFKLKTNSYSITFPNVGDFKRIESLKQVASNGMYSSLVTTNTKQAQKALDIIDVESTFTVLCPELIEKELKSKSFSDLGMKDFNEIFSAYMEQFIPWWNKNLKEVGLFNE